MSAAASLHSLSGDPPPAGVHELASRLSARRQQIVAAIASHVQDVVPIEVDVHDPGYRAGMLAAIGAVLDQRLAAIEHQPGWVVPLPPQAIAQVRTSARSDVSCAAVLRRYMAGSRRLGEILAGQLDCLALPDPVSVLLHVRLTQELFMERLAAALEREYEHELQRIGDRGAGRHLELVRRLLAGEALPLAAEHLPYSLNAWHLAVVILADSRDDALAPFTAYGRVLRVCPDEQTAWGWLALRERPTEPALQRIAVGFPAGVSVAFGEPGRGLEGWRRSHEQAQAALQALLLRPAGRIRYAEVALLTPWLARPDHGRGLIDLYLAPLRSQRDGGAVARATLRAWFEAARNVSAAALRLNVDRRTVAYRLRTIEDALGHPLERRMPELEVALRLQELLEK